MFINNTGKRTTRSLIFLVVTFILSCVTKDTKAQKAMNINKQQQTLPHVNLDARQQAILAISAFTAKGDLVQLHKALNVGLDSELTVNQIKEVLVHLYAYCGFPRSLRGLQTMMTVLDDRKAKGVTDATGSDISPVKRGPNKYARGAEVLEELTGLQQDGTPTGYAAFAPIIDTFLKEHLFADIFERDVLSYQERELVTVSALSSIGGVEPMLRSHLNICLNIGITPGQLQQFITVLKASIGEKDAKSAQAVLDEVLKNDQSK